MDTRDDYLHAADAALTLLRDPAVAAAWDQPSALDLMTVGALAAHLCSQFTNIPPILEAPASEEPPISLLDHYGRVKWRGADLENETNSGIRAGGLSDARIGPAAVADKAAAALERSRVMMPTLRRDTVILVPWTGWSLRLTDFLATRLLEIVVHCDDLAYSVDVPTPVFPVSVTDRVVELLGQLAVQRHGVTNVLRALARAERAPSAINAI